MERESHRPFVNMMKWLRKRWKSGRSRLTLVGSIQRSETSLFLKGREVTDMIIYQEDDLDLDEIDLEKYSDEDDEITDDDEEDNIMDDEVHDLEEEKDWATLEINVPHRRKEDNQEDDCKFIPMAVLHNVIECWKELDVEQRLTAAN